MSETLQIVACVVFALGFTHVILAPMRRIDRELHEIEKQEPGYVPGRTSIPGPS